MEITAKEMSEKIEGKVLFMISMGFSRKEAEKAIEKALKLVKQGKKELSDVITF